MTHQIAARVTATVVREEDLDRMAAALFLRAQASWLRRGLRLADDPAELAAVLGVHEGSHESWVSLIAAVEESVGSRAAQSVAMLYGFHGRIVGSLERGCDLPLEHEVLQQVRGLLAERLTQMTEQAIADIGA